MLGGKTYMLPHSKLVGSYTNGSYVGPQVKKEKYTHSCGLVYKYKIVFFILKNSINYTNTTLK